MKAMAKHWQEQFENVMRDGRRSQFRQRLEWFLFKLHRAVHKVETQSDGSKLNGFPLTETRNGSSRLRSSM